MHMQRFVRALTPLCAVCSVALSAVGILAPGLQGVLLPAIALVLVGGVIMYSFVPQFRENAMVRRVADTLAGAFGHDNGGAAGRGAARGGGPAAEGVKRRLDAAAAAAKRLPIEVFTRPCDLAKESVKKLRNKLRQRGVDTSQCIEKKELVAKLTDTDSSGESCCICVEQYRGGDLLRVLPACGHLFHVSCIDKWIYQTAEKEQAICCPLCKKAIL